MKTLVKILKYLVVVVAAAVVLGAGYQWQAASSDRAQYPAPGEIYAIDGLQMHLDCRGEGEPTVILEAGLLSGSSSWGLVHDPLSEVTRICAYDRAGMDWSTPTDQPVDATSVTRRLHELLDVAGVEGPRVILGMSAGGVFVREYYRRYPEQIVGMVFVDSSHEQQGARLPVIGDPTQMSSVLSLCSWLQPIGVIRALSMMDPFFGQYDIPEEAKAVTLANAYQSHTCASLLLESEGFEREIYDVEPPGSLGDMPLTVLSQGKPPEANETFGMTLEDAETMAVVWDELQNELTALSTVGRRLIAMQSGHVIQLEQPQIVIDEVTAMVVQLRTAARLSVQQ